MIVISEYAFAKLSWFRVNCTDDNIDGRITKDPKFLEVSLMGISESDDNLGYINDFICVPQECSGGLTEPDDDGMNTYLETMLLDKEISIIRCGRFWAHTHPGTSPTPSSTDNETFNKWFGHSDIGVMYILAKGDDSCKVKHASKYFGMNTETMPVYVELDRVDSNNVKIIMTTKTLFAIDKLGISDGYEGISGIMFSDYSDMEDAWMKELRDNVKKKQYHQHIGYQHNTNHNTSHHINHNNQTNKSLIQNNITGIGTQTSVNYKVYNISVTNVIDLLITNDKVSINEFSKDEKKKIYSHYNIVAGELQAKYNELLDFEKSFDCEDLLSYENIFIDNDGKSKFESLTKVQLFEYCKRFVIRPCHLKQTVNKYIEMMFKTPKLPKH